MTSAPPAPDVPSTSASRAGVWLATGLGLGYAPVAPGTAGSLASVALFVLAQTFVQPAMFPLVYVAGLVVLLLAAWWSTEQALRHWQSKDPQTVVIDEVVGQWVAYSGIIFAEWRQLTTSGWKYVVAGFILFRAFDVLKPFPIRRSERLPGAAGVVVDDVLAGLYAAVGLILLAWTGWLN
ncbi:MAG TPA: phosphatidylglycerophosphatase A [Candidatus Acidoferrales bacterium]|nr:phosphatidylglycerophosphatase A [Candidatus Acidoferrales bacterium]